VEFCGFNIGNTKMSKKQFNRITAEHLVNVIKSPSFARNVRSLDKDVNFEKAFAVIQNLNSSGFRVDKITEGDDRGVVEHLDYETTETIACGDSFPLMAVHSHPKDNGLWPSELDLSSQNCIRERYDGSEPLGFDFGVNPIDAIVHASGTRRPKMLFYQSSTRDSIGYKSGLFKEVSDFVFDKGNPEGIIDRMVETGLYNALILPYVPKEFDEETIESFRKFEFALQNK